MTFGFHSPDWMSALSVMSGIWSQIPEVGNVIQLPDRNELLKEFAGCPGVVVIPLMETHLRTFDRTLPSLCPDIQSINVFADKIASHQELIARGFADVLPQTYRTPAKAAFPCVLKRTDLFAGAGIKFVNTPFELFRCLADPVWQGKDLVLEAFVPGNVEYVTHAVCRRGRVLWNHTIACDMKDPNPIRTPRSNVTLRSVDTPPAMLDALARIMGSFGYDGPVNIDYKMVPDRRKPGRKRPVIFDVNPRLGGSLMRPENTQHLVQAVRHIIFSALGAETLDVRRPVAG